MIEALHVSISVEVVMGILSTVVIGVATGLYNHVRECRRIHHTLGRIMEHIGMKE